MRGELLLRSRHGLSGCFVHHVLSGLESGHIVGRDNGMGTIVYVVYLLFGVVFHHERTESAEVNVVSVGHVGLDCGEKLFYDLSDSAAAYACSGMDLFYNVSFGHRGDSLCRVVC